MKQRSETSYHTPQPGDADPRCTQVSDAVDPTVKGGKRFLYIGLAGFLVALGTLGALLPGLPATPFLLLASYLLGKASPQLQARLQQAPLLGPILLDWRRHRGVRYHVKVKAIVVVILCVGLTAVLSGRSWSWTAVVAGLASLGILVIVRLPSLPPETP